MEPQMAMMELPRDKKYPATAAQCDDCGGHGCHTCQERGWLDARHPRARLCARAQCGKRLPPDRWAVYCSPRCAMLDA
jgi:hypothetical protein